MSEAQRVVLQTVQRLLQMNEEHMVGLVGGIQRILRELSALSGNFCTHMTRSGVHSTALVELDTRLAELTTVLRQTVADLERRMQDDRQELRQSAQMATTVATGQAEQSTLTRLREAIQAYGDVLEFEYFVLTELFTGLSFRLRVSANNIEIAASHAGASAGSAPVELFCLIGSQLRGLADRLRLATADLRLFQQTQKGHTEAARQALVDLEQRAVA
jgi:hypothetical protein